MEIIREYLEKSKLPEMLLKRKVELYKKNPDIAEEFEYWIQTGTYRDLSAVSVENYTAKALSELSEFLDGEGAFHLLIQLRENPENALQKIQNGFVIR